MKYPNTKYSNAWSIKPKSIRSHSKDTCIHRIESNLNVWQIQIHHRIQTTLQYLKYICDTKFRQLKWFRTPNAQMVCLSVSLSLHLQQWYTAVNRKLVFGCWLFFHLSICIYGNSLTALVFYLLWSIFSLRCVLYFVLCAIWIRVFVCIYLISIIILTLAIICLFCVNVQRIEFIVSFCVKWMERTTVGASFNKSTAGHAKIYTCVKISDVNFLP